MQTEFEQFLTVIEERPFYFGIGGIGDFLLLLSTFYNEESQFEIVFVANNPSSILAFSKQFKNLRIYPYPIRTFETSSKTWDIITGKNCLGTGVTPKNFEYIKEWIDCRKTSVFDKYGVKYPCEWASNYASTSLNPYLVIQPFGGSEDKTKVKALSVKEFKDIVTITHKNVHTVIIGSPTELEAIKLIVRGLDLDNRFFSYVSDFSEAIDSILKCAQFIGVDSWGKTFAAFAGKTKITVYKNEFEVPPEVLFGHHTDPGDYVFLHGWNFNLIERRK
jgi:hypothetical protein